MARTAELFELARHRTLAFVRVPEAVFWVFAFPVILAAVLGWAFQASDPEPSRIAVVAGAAADGLVQRLDADELVTVERFADREAAEVALRGGRVDALLVEPLASPPVVRLDPARPEAQIARLRVLVAIGEVPAEAVRIDPVEERGSRYVDFLYPGLIGMNLMGTGLWSLGFAIADMRQRKVLKRLLVTPMRRSSFLGSLVLSRLVFLVAEVAFLTAFGAFVLDVPLRSGVLVFATLCTFGALAFSGLGLLAASRVKTIEGVSGLLNFVMMPMWLGSGVFFSYERFPEAIHPVLRLLPLTALNDALRACMIDGAGLTAIGGELLVLTAWLVVPFALALRIFRWT